MIQIPKASDFAFITADKIQTSLSLRYPQVVLHTAFIPVLRENVNVDIPDTIKLIEECQLEQDILVKDTDRGYSSAVYDNRTDSTVIVPPGTHLKGGKQNRGNNSVEVLDPEEERVLSVNCFEPGRGSGTNRFTSFEDVPPDVVQATMNATEGYDGSWKAIEQYTKLVGVGGSALSKFNEKSIRDRAKYALNFETCQNQIGVIVITKGLSMVEIYPNPNTFNIYRERLIRGKVGSLFYKINNERPNEQLLPSEIDIKMRELITYIEKAINITAENGRKEKGLLIGRQRHEGKAMDVVLTGSPTPELVYLFGVW